MKKGTEKMTLAKKYAAVCAKLFQAPTAQLDERWTAEVTQQGGLQLRQDRISKGKLSPEAVEKLLEFIESTFVKEIK